MIVSKLRHFGAIDKEFLRLYLSSAPAGVMPSAG